MKSAKCKINEDNLNLYKYNGYTLIELMVIISIILILSAMAIPGFESLRDRSAIFRAKETFNAIRVAQNLYRQNHPNMYYADNTNQLINYTNVTSVLQRNFFNAPSSLVIQVNNKEEGLGYTITANALDSNKTPVTATEQKVYP